MEVGHLRGVGDDGIDHDHRQAGILGDLVEHDPGPREALRHPWVLPDEHRHLGVLELAARVTAVQLEVDPGFAGLLLRQRIRPVARPQCLQKGAAVGAAEVIALSAAAVVEDLVPAVGITDLFESLGNLDNRRVPVDLLVGAIGSAAHRRAQASPVVLVMVQPQRLVAGAARRPRMRLVAPDAGQSAIVDLHDDAAVALAEDARGGQPIRAGHHRLLSGSSASSRLRSWR
ncbi:Uncharacterised protein [Mycobacterium tuberculosis]|nr:Uncharacterised protein [Mycobacterium tuberculosis]